MVGVKWDPSERGTSNFPPPQSDLHEASPPKWGSLPLLIYKDQCALIEGYIPPTRRHECYTDRMTLHFSKLVSNHYIYQWHVQEWISLFVEDVKSSFPSWTVIPLAIWCCPYQSRYGFLYQKTSKFSAEKVSHLLKASPNIGTLIISDIAQSNPMLNPPIM